MPLADREYMRKEHPPACTCVRCERERVKKYRKRVAQAGRPLWRRLAGKILPWVR